MASNTDQLETETDTVLEHDNSIEALQEILASEQLEPVTYEEARALGYELMVFFEVFDAPGKEERSNGVSPLVV